MQLQLIASYIYQFIYTVFCNIHWRPNALTMPNLQVTLVKTAFQSVNCHQYASLHSTTRTINGRRNLYQTVCTRKHTCWSFVSPGNTLHWLARFTRLMVILFLIDPFKSDIIRYHYWMRYHQWIQAILYSSCTGIFSNIFSTCFTFTCNLNSVVLYCCTVLAVHLFHHYLLPQHELRA